MALNKTGVSDEFWTRTVWKTDSPGLQGLKTTSLCDILIMGMKGWLPGANECPHSLTL
jgi:hypothetical protein